MALNVSFFTQQHREITWLAADAEWDSGIMIILIVLIQGHGSSSKLASVIFKSQQDLKLYFWALKQKQSLFQSKNRI